jgi:hypothetical protein
MRHPLTNQAYREYRDANPGLSADDLMRAFLAQYGETAERVDNGPNLIPHWTRIEALLSVQSKG